MWKWIWIGIVLVLAGAAWNKIKNDKPDASAIAAQRYKGFMEWRAVMTYGSREMEFVGVLEAPLQEDCKPGAGSKELAMACPAGVDCKVKMHECKTTIAPRYAGMLQQKPASVHYVHYRIDDPDGIHNMVWVAWGLTEDEAMSVCRETAAQGVDRPNVTATCI